MPTQDFMKKNTDELANNFLQLARLALTGRDQDVQLLIHRASKKLRTEYPEISDGLSKLLHESPTRSTPLRKHMDTPLPVDIDSRLQLLRIEKGELDHEPIFSKAIGQTLEQVISERKSTALLMKNGLQPTKSLLFNGPPGVGKTMTAKWLSQKLNKPLMILDLAAVMSSYLGRTGNNIRFVLDYAKKTECILLLDEFDSIAKRRDDNSEVGELKRLVTVLLQEIDDWPSTGLLIAATNHPDLLDPAVWRRFEVVVNFENPSQEQVQKLIASLLKDYLTDIASWAKMLSFFFAEKSFSDIERRITLLRKEAALSGGLLEEKLKELFNDVSSLSHNERIELAAALTASKTLSARQATALTGVSRDTIRNRQKGGKKK